MSAGVGRVQEDCTAVKLRGKWVVDGREVGLEMIGEVEG